MIGRLAAALLAGLVLLWGGAISPLADMFPWQIAGFSLFLALFLMLARGGAGSVEPVSAAGAGSRLIEIGFGLATGVATAAVARFVFDAIPHVTDDIAYLFQAKVFASGTLVADSHPLHEFFNFRFFLNDGKWYSLFQPGWPLVLASGVLVGAPWLVNPALAGLTSWLMVRTARRWWGPRAAVLAGAAGLTSPFVLFLGGSMMSHQLVALLALSFVALLEPDGRRDWPAVAIGSLALGAIALVRIYDALCLSVALGLPAVAGDLIRRRYRLAAALPTALGLFVLLQFGYNAATTGLWHQFPQDRYFDTTEERTGCHRIGFGPDVGCLREHGPYARGGFGPTGALAVTGMRMQSLAVFLTGAPVGLLVLILGLLLPDRDRREWWPMAGFAGLAGGYFFFYYHGICFGPRFYYPAAPMLFMLYGRSLDRALGQLRTPVVRLAAAGVLAAGLTSLLINAKVTLPGLLREYGDNYRGVAPVMAEFDRSHQNAAVLISGAELDFAPGFIMDGPDPDRQRNVYLRSFGPGDHLAMEYYKGRDFWLYYTEQGRFIPIPPFSFGGDIYVSGSSKRPAGGNVFAADLALAEPDRVRNVLYFAGRGPGDFVLLRQYVRNPADYRIEFVFAALPAPTPPKVRAFIDGTKVSDDIVAGEIDPIRLERGPHEIRLECAVPSSSGDCVLFIEMYWLRVAR